MERGVGCGGRSECDEMRMQRMRMHRYAGAPLSRRCTLRHTMRRSTALQHITTHIVDTHAALAVCMCAVEDSRAHSSSEFRI